MAKVKPTVLEKLDWDYSRPTDLKGNSRSNEEQTISRRYQRINVKLRERGQPTLPPWDKQPWTPARGQWVLNWVAQNVDLKAGLLNPPADGNSPRDSDVDVFDMEVDEAANSLKRKDGDPADNNHPTAGGRSASKSSNPNAPNSTKPDKMEDNNAPREIKVLVSRPKVPRTKESTSYEAENHASESSPLRWPRIGPESGQVENGQHPRLPYDRLYTHEQLEEAKESVGNMANFLEFTTAAFAIELITLMKENNSRIFRIMNEAFKQLNEDAEEKGLEQKYALSNEHLKEIAMILGPTLYQDRVKSKKDRKTKVEAEVIPDSRGRGVNAKYYIRDNIQLYTKFWQGGRNLYENDRILNSEKTKHERYSFFWQLHKDKEEGRKEVNRIRANSYHTGYREYRTVRAAFDCCARELGGPKSIYENSDDWFTETMEVMDCCREFCLVIFEKDVDTFLNGMKGAMKRADEWRVHTVMEGYSEQQYADLMGVETSHSRFYDVYINVPESELFDFEGVEEEEDTFEEDVDMQE